MNPIQLGYSGVGGINSTPLIAFNVIIDEDFSLISYIIKYVRNHDVFDLEKLKDYTINQIISELYLRTYDNPLYFLMKDEKDKEFLDQCYKEFKETQEYYDKFIISSDFYEAMGMFKQSGEVNPTILCRTDKERQIVNNDPLLSSFSLMMREDVNFKSIQQYKQFYFLRLDDAKDFIQPKLLYKTYYFSSMGLNLTKEKDSLVDSKCAEEISKYMNHINIFDMYKQQTIGRALY